MAAPARRPTLTCEAAASLLDAILERHRPALGADADAYRNHCQRVFRFCRIFAGERPADDEKSAIAAAFHDLGIWEFHTFDYLPGSCRLARHYLAERGLADWAPEVEAMIDHHHKLTPFRGENARLVEAFRRADWTDVSLGLLHFGLRHDSVSATRAAFANCGFHRRLVSLTLQRLRRHPFSPFPMMKL